MPTFRIVKRRRAVVVPPVDPTADYSIKPVYATRQEAQWALDQLQAQASDPALLRIVRVRDDGRNAVDDDPTTLPPDVVE
jgi:hypothetical protein